MMMFADKVGGWVKKGQNHDDVILEWSPSSIGQNFVKYFVRFLGDGVSRKNCFEIY